MAPLYKSESLSGWTQLEQRQFCGKTQALTGHSEGRAQAGCLSALTYCMQGVL